MMPRASQWPILPLPWLRHLPLQKPTYGRASLVDGLDSVFDLLEASVGGESSGA